MLSNGTTQLVFRLILVFGLVLGGAAAQSCLNNPAVVNIPSASDAIAPIVSPDGQHVYVAAHPLLVKYDRDSDTGILSNSVEYSFNRVGRLDISPDGRHVYAVSEGEQLMHGYERDTGTGELSNKVTESLPACDVKVSPDGHHVYFSSCFDPGSIFKYDRDASTGSLSNKVDYTSSDLAGAYSVTVSPDGQHVYASTYASEQLVKYDRDASTGALSNLKTWSLRDLFPLSDYPAGWGTGGYGLVVSPNGQHVYVGGHTTQSVTKYDRDSGTGDLSNPAPTFSAALVASGDIYNIAISPNGHHVYATARTSDAILTYDRDSSTGELSDPTFLIDGTTLNAPGTVTVSPDGKHVYTTGGAGAHLVVKYDACSAPPSPPSPPSPLPPTQPPSPPPPPTGLHLASDDAKVHFGQNMECTLELKPGPPPYLESSCPVNTPPPHPSLPPIASPSPPTTPPPSLPPFAAAVCVVGGVNGQWDAGGALVASSEKFTIATGTWSSIASMPTPRHWPLAVSFGSYMYVIGGTSQMHNGAYQKNTNKCEKFDTSAQTWSACAGMAFARGHGFAAAELGGYIYVAGGRAGTPDGNGEVQSNAGEYLGTVATGERYNPSSNSWSAITSMSTARTHASGAAIGNYFYVVSGHPHTASCERYDPSTDTWSAIAALPNHNGATTGTIYNAVVAMGQFLYSFGGIVPGTNTAITTVFKYDSTANTWGTNIVMPSTRQGVAAAVAADKIYVAGGESGATAGRAYLDTAQSYDPASNTWTNLPNMGAVRQGAAMAVCEWS